MTLEEYIKERREVLKKSVEECDGSIVDRAHNGARKYELDMLETHYKFNKINTNPANTNIKFVPLVFGILIGLSIFQLIKAIIF